jgi:ATP-dependent DNA helicase RecQ
MRLGHNKLSTFGLLAERHDRQVKDWIGQLVGAGLLTQTAEQYPVLKLNDASWEVMRGKREVKLTRSGAATASRKSRVEEISWEGVDPTLFETLRAWRREVAARKGMAPFTIFHDGTLREISRIRPSTLEGLHLISGVGEAKLQEYGQEVLNMVARICREQGLSMDNAADSGGSGLQFRLASIEAAQASFVHFRQGKSIAAVAAILDRAESTVRDYLCTYIYTERPGRIDTWVDQATLERITLAARQHGTQRLKPVFLALNQEVSYDVIRMVLTYLNTRPNSEINVVG